MEIFLMHSANLLYAICFLVRDILWLRLIAIVAILTEIIYFYAFSHELTELWTLILWNVVFVIVNTYQSGVLIRQRIDLRLSVDEQRIYDLAFNTMTPLEFKKIYQTGYRQVFDANSKLLEEGRYSDIVFMLSSGRVSVLRDGKVIAKLNGGAFVGEMSVARSSAASATVEADTELECYCWSKAALTLLFKDDPSLKAAYQTVLAKDMANKLEATGMFELSLA